MATLTLAVPADFQLAAVVAAHGWAWLRPFAWDARRSTLSGVLRGAAPLPLAFEVRQDGAAKLAVRSAATLDRASRDRVARSIASMLGTTIDLGAFHAHCRREPALRWIARRHYG